MTTKVGQLTYFFPYSGIGYGEKNLDPGSTTLQSTNRRLMKRCNQSSKYKVVSIGVIYNAEDPDPGWEKFGSGINIPDPQSATLLIDRKDVIY
jgi:hypothetical protein